jgi:preprotein translocase subunit SecD
LLAVAMIACLGCKARQAQTVLVYAFDIPADREGRAGRDAKPDIDKAVAAVDRRLNPGGSWNKTAKVRRLSDTTLEVRLPATEPAAVARIDRLVMALGSLEFRVLANEHDDLGLIERSKAMKPDVTKLCSSTAKLEACWVPVNPGTNRQFDYPEIARRTVAKDGKQVLQILVKIDRFNVTGAYLTRAAPDVDQRGRPDLTFQFNYAGGRKFGGLTSGNLPDEASGFTRKLGIILDGYLYSAPSIQSTIQDRGEITGSFTRSDVNDLAAVLNAGVLPAPLKRYRSVRRCRDARGERLQL